MNLSAVTNTPNAEKSLPSLNRESNWQNRKVVEVSTDYLKKQDVKAGCGGVCSVIFGVIGVALVVLSQMALAATLPVSLAAGVCVGIINASVLKGLVTFAVVGLGGLAFSGVAGLVGFGSVAGANSCQAKC